MPTIKVIIPAFNEEKSIAKVIADIPDFVEEIVVVNNNSTDQTALVAAKAGATVLTEKSKGYGYACLKGINYLSQKIKLQIYWSSSMEIFLIFHKNSLKLSSQ